MESKIAVGINLISWKISVFLLTSIVFVVMKRSEIFKGFSFHFHKAIDYTALCSANSSY